MSESVACIVQCPKDTHYVRSVPLRLHMEHPAPSRGVGGTEGSEGVQPVMGYRRFAAQQNSTES